MSKFEIYTDGSCSGNPGPGGWGVVLLENQNQYDLSGGEAATTNNRMELTAVIRGLEATPEGSSSVINSDSQYIVNTMNLGWKRNANKDLWAALDSLVKSRDVKFIWVKGHAGNTWNEKADRLAVEAMEQKK
jgi:ribonuclease HI